MKSRGTFLEMNCLRGGVRLFGVFLVLFVFSGCKESGENSIQGSIGGVDSPQVAFSSSPSNPSPSSSGTFVFSMINTTKTGFTMQCALDGAAPVSCSSPYNVSGLSDGNHSLVVTASEGGRSVSATSTWNVNTIVISGGTSFIGQQATAWSQGFSVTGGSGTFTYSLVTGPGGSSVNAVPTVSFTPASVGTSNFTLRATDTVSGNTKDLDFTLNAYPAAVCVWNGSVNTSWANVGNWSNCGGGAPIATTNVAISSGATNMPVLTGNTTVNSFGYGTGGGTITVNAGVTLTITATASSIRSSVMFQGNTSTCSTCIVVGAGDLAITDDATVTMLKGIQFSPAWGSRVYVGNGATNGNLETGAAGSFAEWPVSRSPAPSPGFIVVNGTAAKRSTIKLDGINLNAINGATTILFQDWYEIKQLDNMYVDYYGGNLGASGGEAVLRFSVCTNALITDTTWSSFNFNNPPNTGGYNVRVDGTNCNTLSAVSISSASGSGNMGFGPGYALDTWSRITWLNSSTYTCTWTGTVSTAWTNSGNWSGCSNGRNNYPDQLDYVIVPVTGNQPLASSNVVVRGFAVGTGGGTITVAAGKYFWIGQATSSIRSDVKFQGDTSTCTTCVVNGLGELAITDGATLTLLKGIAVGPANGTRFFVGDGVTGGNLMTGPAGMTTEYPIFSTNGTAPGQLVVQGAAGQKSIIKLDGFKVAGGNFVNMIAFQDYYDIQQLDNLSLTFYGNNNATGGYSSLRFNACTNATFTDTTWSAIDFNATIAGGFNVWMGGTNCNTAPIININGIGLGAGAGGASDPFARLSWF